ncbi:response regulator transcription factor [Roseomonas elaeocarpi]|uniref:Response regulator transcription factor n=1 Tax=Roseomonas elaeocarpi TaxID=907779 RepID=A0ABV6JYV7_9PROT
MRQELIAIVEDDDTVRVAIANLLRSADLRSVGFASAEAFLAEDLSGFGCVLSDVQMPGLSGLDLLRVTRQRRAELPVVLMTAYPDERVRQRALAEGARFFLEKPTDPEMLVANLRALLDATPQG